MEGGISALFEPRSIAVIGASTDAGALGARPGRYLQNGGFSGALHLVNPTTQAHGFVSSIAQIPEGSVDLALVLVGARRAVDAVEECAKAGVSAAIVGAAGFAEAGPEGEELERRLGQLAQRYGIRILGPNCLGVVNHRFGNYATFATLNDGGLRLQGAPPVAIVSQSGAFASYVVATLQAAGVGVATWISTGNEVDVDVADCLSYVAARRDIRLVITYLEGSRDGMKLVRAIRECRAAGQVLVAMKAGRSAAGMHAVASHTSAIAGVDAVYDAALRSAGAIRANDFTDLISIAQVLKFGAAPSVKGLGVLTLSGGVGALMADEAADFQLPLPPIPEEVRRSMTSLIPFAAVDNPIDATGAVADNPAVFETFLRGVAGTKSIDAVAIFAGPALVDENYGRPIIEAVARVKRDTKAYVLVAGALEPYAVAALDRVGVPLINDPIAAIRALGRIALSASPQADRNTVARGGGIDWLPHAEAPLRRRIIQRLARRQRDLERLVVSEIEGKQLLKAAGIGTPLGAVIRTSTEACQFLAKVGAPIVLKAIVDGVVHKSRSGLVRLGLGDTSAVSEAFTQLRDTASRYGSEVSYLAESQADVGVEVLVDVRFDDAFGAVLSVGAGGLDTESENDVAVCLADITRSRLLAEIEALRVGRRLTGAAGRPKRDVPALVDACFKMLRLLSESKGVISEIEVNPIRVFNEGAGVTALDAVVWLAARTQ